jgi:hypothetical protein
LQWRFILNSHVQKLLIHLKFINAKARLLTEGVGDLKVEALEEAQLPLVLLHLLLLRQHPELALVRQVIRPAQKLSFSRVANKWKKSF